METRWCRSMPANHTSSRNHRSHTGKPARHKSAASPMADSPSRVLVHTSRLPNRLPNRHPTPTTVPTKHPNRVRTLG
jgi:hypothetical protein